MVGGCWTQDRKFERVRKGEEGRNKSGQVKKAIVEIYSEGAYSQIPTGSKEVYAG